VRTPKTIDLLRKHGAKTGTELKAEGKEALKAKETMMLLTFQFPINLPKSNRNPWISNQSTYRLDDVKKGVYFAQTTVRKINNTSKVMIL